MIKKILFIVVIIVFVLSCLNINYVKAFNSYTVTIEYNIGFNVFVDNQNFNNYNDAEVYGRNQFNLLASNEDNTSSPKFNWIHDDDCQQHYSRFWSNGHYLNVVLVANDCDNYTDLPSTPIPAINKKNK